MDWKDSIISNENVLLGKPIIKGTRISVEHIVSLFSQGWTDDAILSNYTNLTHQHLQAVKLFSKELQTN